jgi:hypothetical protein
LLAAALPLCKNETRAFAGVRAMTRESFAREWRSAAESLYGVDDRPRVVQVVRGSPAEKAGLRPGDILLAVNDRNVSADSDELAGLDAMLATGAAPAARTARFKILRGNDRETLNVETIAICGFELKTEQSAQPGAHADGKSVVVSEPMMRFFENDDEMALVVSHEIAHNAMRHIDAGRENIRTGAGAGLILDILAAVVGVDTGGVFMNAGANIGNEAYSIAFEQEADYVGLYIMARAGRRIEDAPNFWRRMATLSPESITEASSHPTAPERFLALEKTVAEIDGKRATGLALLPDVREPSSAASAPPASSASSAPPASSAATGASVGFIDPSKGKPLSN